MKKVENQYVPLHHFEIFCYIVIWASGIFYAAYNLLDVSSSKNLMKILIFFV